MRDVVLKMSISLDGFVSGPDGEADWMVRDPEALAWTTRSVSQAGVHIMGSRSFADMARFYPTSTAPFAPPMNDIPKVVFSTRPDLPLPADAGSWSTARVASGSLREEVIRLAGEPGAEIVAHGGAAFARSLVAEGLVDEYRLLTHPVLLGRGQPIFTGLGAPAPLELVDLTRFPSGAVAQTFRRR